MTFIRFFLPIGKVRVSQMSIDFEGSAFEMCCFGLVMNLENLIATSKFFSTFPLELLRVGEKYSSIMLFKPWLMFLIC